MSRRAVPERIRRRIRIGKYGGDDAFSWAVFLDGRPVFTGLGRREVDHYRRLTVEIVENRDQTICQNCDGDGYDSGAACVWCGGDGRGER